MVVFHAPLREECRVRRVAHVDDLQRAVVERRFAADVRDITVEEVVVCPGGEFRPRAQELGIGRVAHVVEVGPDGGRIAVVAALVLALAADRQQVALDLHVPDGDAGNVHVVQDELRPAPVGPVDDREPRTGRHVG